MTMINKIFLCLIITYSLNLKTITAAYSNSNNDTQNNTTSMSEQFINARNECIFWENENNIVPISFQIEVGRINREIARLQSDVTALKNEDILPQDYAAMNSLVERAVILDELPQSREYIQKYSLQTYNLYRWGIWLNLFQLNNDFGKNSTPLSSGQLKQLEESKTIILEQLNKIYNSDEIAHEHTVALNYILLSEENRSKLMQLFPVKQEDNEMIHNYFLLRERITKSQFGSKDIIELKALLEDVFNYLSTTDSKDLKTEKMLKLDIVIQLHIKLLKIQRAEHILLFGKNSGNIIDAHNELQNLYNYYVEQIIEQNMYNLLQLPCGEYDLLPIVWSSNFLKDIEAITKEEKLEQEILCRELILMTYAIIDRIIINNQTSKIEKLIYE